MADPKFESVQTKTTKSEQTQSLQKDNTESENNLTEKIIAELGEKLDKELEDNEKTISEQMSQVDALAAGHEKEIEALKMRDEALAARDAEIAESELEMEKSRFEIENIRTNIDNLLLKKSFQERDKVSREKYRDKLKVELENNLQKSEKYVIKISEYSQKDSRLASFARRCYETKLTKLAEEVNEQNDKLSNLEKEIQAMQQAIAVTEEGIITNRNMMKEKATALRAEELKSNQKKKTHEAEKAGAQGAMPEWYVKYKTAEGALNEARNRQISIKDKINNNAANVAGMRKVVLQGKDNTEKEVLVSEEGEIYGDTTGVEEGAKVVAEEQKVASQIRGLEVFKAVNKDTIQEFLKYNPETGDKFRDDEEAKSDVTFEHSIAQLGDTIKEFKPAIQKIIDDPKLAEIEQMLFEPLPIKRPLQAILTGLISASDLGVSALQKISELREWIMSDTYRKENPFKYNVAILIVNYLGDTLDNSDKGEYSDKKLYGSLAGAAFVPMAGNKIGGFISTLLGIMDTKSWGALIGWTALKLAKTESGVASNASDVIKGASTGFEEALQAHFLSGEIKAWKEQKDPQMVRILEAAKRARINKSVDGFVDTGASATKMVLANGKGLGTIANLAISAASAGLKFAVGIGFEKYDKHALLTSPEVFGNLHYDTNLVNDEKFDNILKNSTGITSKDKVYSAIKTTDAISIHQRMMRSLIKPDHAIERLLSGLGFQDRTKYPNIRITDIMKKTGYSAAGGDWRRELKDTLLVEGKDYRTLMQSIGDGIKHGAKAVAAWGGDVAATGVEKAKNSYKKTKEWAHGLSMTEEDLEFVSV